MVEQVSNPVYRLLQKRDLTDVLKLMRQSAFPISGLSSRPLYRAICMDALRDNRMLIGVAELDRRVVGFLVVIVDWRAYWRAFLFRHLLVGSAILWRRLMRQRSRESLWQKMSAEQRRQVVEVISTEASGRSWSDSGPVIAKGVFLHIDPACRRRGLAVDLYRYLFDLLASRGISRCDAKVDIVNTRAFPLHQRMGYRLERVGDSLFATTDLPRGK